MLARSMTRVVALGAVAALSLAACANNAEGPGGEGSEGSGAKEVIVSTDLPPGATATGWGAKFDEKGQNTRAKPMLMQWQGGAQVTVSPEAAAVGKLRPVFGA